MITSLTLLILSLVALYIGAGWLVQGSSALALKAKISPLVVGLTIVAFGTSAPELVVSLNATLSGQGDIAIGNIVGSNIFNIGVILGVSATICPLQVKKQLLRIDIPVMLARPFCSMFAGVEEAEIIVDFQRMATDGIIEEDVQV